VSGASEAHQAQALRCGGITGVGKGARIEESATIANIHTISMVGDANGNRAAGDAWQDGML
jgi:hypothetical protein